MDMNRINKKIIILVILLIAGIQANGEEVVEAIVAVVNGDIITLSDFKQQDQALYQSLSGEYQGEELEAQYKKIRKGLLDRMITDLLLIQEAEKQAIDVSGQLENMIENMKEQYGFSSIEEIKRAMSQQGIDYESWLDIQEKQLLKESVIFYSFGKDIAVDGTEVVNYYRQNQDEFMVPTTFELKAIYLSDTGRIEEELRGKREEILGKLEAGEGFEDLAKKYSEGPYRETGGELGSIEKGTLEKTLEEGVDNLEIGEVSPWVHTSNGWYLLKLIDKKEEHVKSFDEVREEIENKIFQKKREEKTIKYIEELKEKSYIEIKIQDPYTLL